MCSRQLWEARAAQSVPAPSANVAIHGMVAGRWGIHAPRNPADQVRGAWLANGPSIMALSAMEQSRPLSTANWTPPAIQKQTILERDSMLTKSFGGPPPVMNRDREGPPAPAPTTRRQDRSALLTKPYGGPPPVLNRKALAVAPINPPTYVRRTLHTNSAYPQASAPLPPMAQRYYTDGLPASAL